MASGTSGRYLHTLVYLANSIQNADQLTYYADHFSDTKADEQSAQRRGARHLKETCAVIDDQISGSEWVLGNRSNLGDLHLFLLTTWRQADRGHLEMDEFPDVKRIADMVLQRPSVQRVFAD